MFYAKYSRIFGGFMEDFCLGVSPPAILHAAKTLGTSWDQSQRISCY